MNASSTQEQHSLSISLGVLAPLMESPSYCDLSDVPLLIYPSFSLYDP